MCCTSTLLGGLVMLEVRNQETKTKAGALKQQSGDSFPYGAKYGTGQGYQAQEVPAESTDTFIAGSAPASAIAQARDAAEADILDN